MSPLYKNEINGILFGVCAGLANYFKLNIILIRLFFIILFPMSLIIYIILALLLPTKPRLNQSSTYFNKKLDALETQLLGIKQDVIRLEDYVTSDEFELQRKIWEL